MKIHVFQEKHIKKHWPNPPNHCVYSNLKTPADRHDLPLLRRLNCKWKKNVDRFVECM